MSSLKEKINELVATYNTEVEKANGGNSAAGTRARKALQELTLAAKSERANIQALKNSRK